MLMVRLKSLRHGRPNALSFRMTMMGLRALWFMDYRVFACTAGVLIAGFMAGCAGPSSQSHSSFPRAPGVSLAGMSLTRDHWGHRPGPRGFHTVIIDAGHGGHDAGAVSRATGDREKQLALDTARRLASKLGSDFRTVFIRTGDRFVDLDDRVALANRHEGAILVSLHYNASPRSTVRGPETYYWRVDSHGLATRIQRALEEVVPGSAGNLGLSRRRLRLTRNPEIPCVLVEFGYLSNAAEAHRCANPAYRERLVGAVAEAIQAQARMGDAGTGPKPKPLYQPLSRPTDPPGS